MPRNPDDELEVFLLAQDVPTLAGVLLELSGEHDAVRKRLDRLRLADKPSRLAASFRKSLNAWRRSTRFVSYGEAGAFGRELEHWLAQVERELLPRDPAAALELAEAFIQSDASFIERTDDSDGAVGSALRAGCLLWLKAAARCEAPPDQWPDRLLHLARDDGYGVREDLLLHADLLLDESAMRQLVARFEDELRTVLADAQARGESHLPVEVFTASGPLTLLSQALRDPDVQVRAVQMYSPEPNALQKAAFARAYLDCDRAEDALGWLEGSWGPHEGQRQGLLSESLERLGRVGEAAPVRRQIFERSLAVTDLHHWLDDLPVPDQPAAVAQARQLALAHPDPAGAALLLLEIHDDQAAEAALVDGARRLNGGDYYTLPALARTLEERALMKGATAVYRALLTDLLTRAYAKAYPYGARYWLRLAAIASVQADLSPLEPHATFVATVRAVHGRKPRFWQCVNEAEMKSAMKNPPEAGE
jgi:hypothetical protein